MNIPNIYKGEDITLTIAFLGNNPTISVNGITEGDFTTEFEIEFEVNNITEVSANVLVNDINQEIDTTPNVEDEILTLEIPGNELLEKEKGLLEVEFLFTYTEDGDEKHSINRIAVCWLLNSHLA